MAGCTISPLAFTLAMEVIIRASRWVVGRQRIKPGLRLPPVRAYMDDLTTLTVTKACTARLLGKLQENIELARMKIKPSKSRSISIVKGKLSDHRFHIGKELEMCPIIGNGSDRPDIDVIGFDRRSDQNVISPIRSVEIGAPIKM